MLNFIIDLLSKILGNVSPEVAKKAIDKALDVVEEHLQKDGLTAWEKVAFETIQLLRKVMGITEEPGSGYEDK